MATNAVESNFPTISSRNGKVPRNIHSATYEGDLIGPTLRLKPGDTLKILFKNRLPDNPEGRCAEEECAFPHDPYTTNLHTHGWTVSPMGISDNVLRKFEPGRNYPIKIHLPSDHPTGTFFYHPHKHGAVTTQFFGGMAGFLIVEGGKGTLDDVPEVAAAKDLVMGFQLLRAVSFGNPINRRNDTDPLREINFLSHSPAWWLGGLLEKSNVPFVNQTATLFSSLPKGNTKNGNCTNEPFLQCIGPNGPTGDFCATTSDCPAESECVGKSCQDDADCSEPGAGVFGSCQKFCNLSGPPDEASLSCSTAAECGTADAKCTGWSAGCTECGIFSPYQESAFFLTTNGEANPTLHMYPGEVQRWRLLNAVAGVSLVLAVQKEPGGALTPNVPIHVIAQDGITLPEMVTLEDRPIVMGAGNRVDVLFKAPSTPGTYQLKALDPNCDCAGFNKSISDPVTSCAGTPTGACSSPGKWSVSLTGEDSPAVRTQKIAFDLQDDFTRQPKDFPQQLHYPIPLVTIKVSGKPKDMGLPTGPLPVPNGLPSVETMLTTLLAHERAVAYEICGFIGVPTDAFASMGNPNRRLPSCGWFRERYDADYWGGTVFNNLLMMRDALDVGIPSNADPNVLRVGYQKEGLFDGSQPLYDNMDVDTFEEWTIINRSFSDHPHHVHQNPFLITRINGIELSQPEWRDTVIVPAATIPGTEDLPPQSIPQANANNLNINNECTDRQQNANCQLDPESPNHGANCCFAYGTIKYRTYFNPVAAGRFVMHCHMLMHEDTGMMQLLQLNDGEAN